LAGSEDGKMTKTRAKKLILGGDPEQPFKTPGDDVFEAGEYLDAPEIAEIGEALIAERLVFESLRESPIVFLWKRKGAEKPRRLLGKCQRPSGLLSHFAQAHFVVWPAANNCKGLTAWQIEALIFHELKHAKVEDDKPISVPHDWEGFAEELQRYGLWKSDMEPIAEAIGKTMKLPFPPSSPAPLGSEERLREIATDFVAGQPIGDGISSVTIAHGDKSVTIREEDVKRAREERRPSA
jgi:hypothetical protein